MAKALESYYVLDTLCLDDNQIGDDGATALAKLLEIHALISLDLSSNQIGDKGATDLAKALKSSYTLLITLNFGKNQITNIGAKALAEALESNDTLRDLYLDSNQVGDEGANALLDIMDEDHSKLDYLYLNGKTYPRNYLIRASKEIGIPFSDIIITKIPELQ